MPNESTCEACAYVHRGPEPDASPDGIRAQRLLLAVLNGSADHTALIAQEIGDCADCRGRLLSLYLAMCAGLFVHVSGSHENAIDTVERGLMADLDGQ